MTKDEKGLNMGKGILKPQKFLFKVDYPKLLLSLIGGIIFLIGIPFLLITYYNETNLLTREDFLINYSLFSIFLIIFLIVFHPKKKI